MKHVFEATELGWESSKYYVWFDADMYTEDEARAEFKPYDGVTRDGWPYTGYEYDGVKYHDFRYVGTFDDDNMPT